MFAVLKARGWATSLVAGEGALSFSNRSFFMCKVDLTDEGKEASSSSLSQRRMERTSSPAMLKQAYSNMST